MSDTAYPVFQHYGTHAQRLAFTPSPPATGQPIYIWYETDTGNSFLYDTSWHQITTTSTGNVTTGVTLTSGKTIVGNGGVDIALSSLTGTVVKSSSGTLSAASAGTDYVAPGSITTDGITQNTGKLLGRTTASAGAIEEITPGASMVFSAGALNGRIVQVQKTISVASSTGTTQIPSDDTIPQNTEGTEFFTCAITPTNASNRLLIQVSVDCASSVIAWMIAALFQDTTANALAAGAMSTSSNNAISTISFTYEMAAGTTSSTTFKVRVGPDRAATITINGASGSRVLGGVMSSSITIWEISA